MLNFLIDDWLLPSVKVAHQEKIISVVGCLWPSGSRQAGLEPQHHHQIQVWMMKSTKQSLVVVRAGSEFCKNLDSNLPCCCPDCGVLSC